MNKIFAVVLCVCLSGCSTVTLLNRPPKKNLSVLSPGTSREQVIAELGTPVRSRKAKGRTIETFAFDPGVSGGLKTFGAACYIACDLMTLFIGELFLWPSEKMQSGPHTTVEVSFDADEMVQTATCLETLTLSLFPKKIKCRNVKFR